MTIIFEGCNSVGKSIFIKKYLNNRCVIKDSSLARNKLVQENLQKIQLTLFKSIPSIQNDDVIFDRFYPSEIVYGLDRYSIDFDFYKEIDAEFAKINFKLLFIQVPYETMINSRCTKEEYIRFNERYYDFLSWTKLPFKIFNKTYEENSICLKEYFNIK